MNSQQVDDGCKKTTQWRWRYDYGAAAEDDDDTLFL